MSLSHWLRGKSGTLPDETSDVVILGGGYIGLSVAWWLTEYRPDLKIIVLEKSKCGDGASGRNAGFLTAGSSAFYKSLSEKWGQEKALAILSYAKESLQSVHDHILSQTTDVVFEQSRSVTLLKDSSSFKAQEFGFEWKDRSSLPDRLKERFAGGFERSPEYEVNPLSLLNSLKKALNERKVKIIENVSGYKINAESVSTDTHEIKTKKVILALNGYFPQFHTVFQNLITPRRAQMMAVQIPDGFEASGLYYDPAERVYWRKAEDNILIIGGKRLLDEAGEVGDFDKVSPLIQEGLEDYIKNQLQLKYKVINRWSGTMGFTEHELPYLTQVKANLPVVMAGGFSGHGMGFGFKAAQEVAELSLGKVSHSFFDSFRPLNISL